MKKRYLLVVLALSVTLAFAGCSGSSQTSNTQASDSEEAPEDMGTMGIVTSITSEELIMETMKGGGGERGQGGEAPAVGERPEDGAAEPPTDGERPDVNEMPQMETETLTLVITDETEFYDEEGNVIIWEDFAEGDMIFVETDDDNHALTVTKSRGMREGGGEKGPGGDIASAPSSYTAVTTYSEDAEVKDETYASEGTDENAILVDSGAIVSLSNVTVNRDSDDSTGGDSSSFYGIGAAILTIDGTASIDGATIETNAAGGAGVFAYDQGVVNISDSTITTTQDTAGGIHAAGGGTLNASNLIVTTGGESSAAIRSDRGGGTMNVEGGTYTSNGTGSPAVYCTADITVKDAELAAANSEAICIEGLNSLTLENCNLTGNIPDNEQNDCNWNVILYQSMSGDSEIGNSTFNMTGGSITAENGGMFYTTNTESTFNLSDVELNYSDTNDFLLKCTGNSNQRGWGTEGENGADCTFETTDQEMEGNVIWDSISDLQMTLGEGSTWTGAMVQDESNAGEGGDGTSKLTVKSGATWVVTGDSNLTSLTNDGTIVDMDGNTVSVVGIDGTVYVKGNSSYTITVAEKKRLMKQ